MNILIAKQTYYVPGMVLSSGDVAVNKTNTISPLMMLKFQWGHILCNLFILTSVKAHLLWFFLLLCYRYFLCPWAYCSPLCWDAGVYPGKWYSFHFLIEFTGVSLVSIL